ncbi:hypothetical protein BGZ83_004243 [Gryganskiella cystojenkinii]|nr:hypothetical protein BGZ83_004243 [Gryganskiella cystojenkinii]
MGLESLELEDGAKTPPQRLKSTPRMLLRDTKTTPKGSNIHSEVVLHQASPGRRTELEIFKRRLQFKNGARTSLMNSDTYKDLERKEKMKDYMDDQRGKRDLAQFKSRGLSLPAISRTRQTSLLIPTKPGEAPTVQFIPRHNLRSLARPLTIVQQPDEISNLEISKASKASIDKRKLQYRQDKNKHDRDETWRSKRIESYVKVTKTARESALFKKRNLTICGWGNSQKNLGNYLSITWDYMPSLDADPDHSLPGRSPVALNCVNVAGVKTESGVIYHPETTDCEDDRLTGYVFTIQSELAIRYESAQRELFDQASRLVRECFLPYHMDLSLDSSLDDNFTIEIYVSSKPYDDESKLTVRGVTQFIFMKEFIYVDKICVSKEHQKIGIGAFMMERIKKLAMQRKKDVLLYALGPVIDVYLKWGFEYCKEWPPIPNDVGAIMRSRMATRGVVEDYDGPTWNGTSFS